MSVGKVCSLCKEWKLFYMFGERRDVIKNVTP